LLFKCNLYRYTKMFQAYGKAVSKIMEDFDVEGRMSLKDWLSFCADASIVGGPKVGDCTAAEFSDP
jgi:hypothetical protein